MPTRPVYHKPPEKVSDWSVLRAGLAALVENLFFGAAALLAVGFAFIVLRAGLSAWTSAVYLVVFWAVMAYLALPRVHRVLTAIYVPGYFFGRTRTSDGLLGDPVNLAVTGSEAQIHAAMQKAGWVRADPVDLRSSIRIVTASLRRRSYSEAPVSPLFLFGAVQQFAYQQEVEGNPAQRHHVRFWECPPGWLLPGGHRVDWLAAGTYDRAVGLSLFTMQVTHKIDRDIDIERDFVVDTVLHAVPEATVRVIKDFSTGYHSRNGGGDRVTTDGNLPVLELGDVPVSDTLSPEGMIHRAGASGHDDAADVDHTASGGWAHRREPTSGGHGDDLLERVGRRPPTIVAAIVLTFVSALISLGTAVTELDAAFEDVHPAGLDPAAGATELAVFITLVVEYVILALLAWRTYAGSRAARLAMLVMIVVTQFGQVVHYLGTDRPPFVSMLSMTVDLLAIYALTSLSARAWTDAQRRRRLADRGQVAADQVP